MNIDVKFPARWKDQKLLIAKIEFYFQRHGYRAFVCPSAEVEDIETDPAISDELMYGLMDLLLEK